MVAPIALFSDKLLGQVLAGATYPEQIAAANEWLGQHSSLKGAALQNAETSNNDRTVNNISNVLNRRQNLAVNNGAPVAAGRVQPAHFAAAPQMQRYAPPSHNAPAMQQAPLPHREADPGHGQPQRNHQDMHAAQARPAVQHPDHHVASHERSARHQQDRDRRDAHERRG